MTSSTSFENPMKDLHERLEIIKELNRCVSRTIFFSECMEAIRKRIVTDFIDNVLADTSIVYQDHIDPDEFKVFLWRVKRFIEIPCKEFRKIKLLSLKSTRELICSIFPSVSSEESPGGVTASEWRVKANDCMVLNQRARVLYFKFIAESTMVEELLFREASNENL